MTAEQIAVFIIGTIAVVFAAYFTTYFIAAKSNKIQKGRMVKVIDRMSLSRDKTIYILEIKDQIYILAMTAQSVVVIDTLSNEFAEDLEANGPLGMNSVPFKAGALLADKLKELSSKVKLKRLIEKEEAPLNEPKEDGLDIMFRKIEDRKAHDAASDASSLKEGGGK